jgi:hypothetical protein
MALASPIELGNDASTSRRTTMPKRIIRVERAGTHRGLGRAAATDGWRPSTCYRVREAECRNATPRATLARRLETSQCAAGRVARWLFVNGGVVLVVIPGLMLLGLAGAVLGIH